MFAPLNRLMAIVILCGLRVPPAQAERVDSLRVEDDKEGVEALLPLNDRAVTRIPKKVFVGGLTTIGVSLIAAGQVQREMMALVERLP